mmetsp:Transcript_1368/g.4260  ORF Transcript_1368/g.4260 Transcript_1368/m.4260 type:complete len:191 (-) Transcript_1368:30-602(-)
MDPCSCVCSVARTVEPDPIYFPSELIGHQLGDALQQELMAEELARCAEQGDENPDSESRGESTSNRRPPQQHQPKKTTKKKNASAPREPRAHESSEESGDSGESGESADEERADGRHQSGPPASSSSSSSAALSSASSPSSPSARPQSSVSPFHRAAAAPIQARQTTSLDTGIATVAILLLAALVTKFLL